MQLKKSLRVFTLNLVLITQNTHVAMEQNIPEVTRLQEKAIEEHRKSLAWKLQMNAVVVYGLKAAVIAAVGFTVYKMRGYGEEPDFSSTELDCLSCDQNGYVQIPKKVWRDVVRRLIIIKEITERAARGNGEVSFGSWQWCKGMFRFIRDHAISLALTQGVAMAGDSLRQRIFHAGDINWCIATQTYLMQTLEEILQYAYALEDDSSHTHIACEYFIISAANSLARQLELIIAFMEYKRLRASEVASVDIARIERCVFACSNNFLSNIEIIMGDAEVSEHDRKKNLEDLVAKFRVELTRNFMSFARFEKLRQV